MDTREDAGEFYPGGKVVPRQPVRPGGGGTVVLDDTVTEGSQNGVKSSGIWAWVKSLLPSWLTPSREEPPTQECIVGKRPVKPLPKYLHYLAFDDPYKADAEAWYESLAPDAMGGACSAIRKGVLLGRNYDWTFDNAAEFVVRMSAAEGRHASVGVASLGAALSEDEAASGVYSPKYRAFPGMTLDGINDAGVVCEINVIPRGSGDPAKGGVRDLHPLAAVRYVLDHFATAEEAATYVATHYYIPDTSAYSFHWMIADAEKTYIVEDGDKHEVTGVDGSMTNYRLYAADVYGTGYKRKEILDDAENVESAIAATHFTNAYAEGWPWPDEFAMDAEIPHTETDALKAWATTHVTPHLDPVTRKPKERDGTLWHTVHSSIYDFAAKTMRVAVQESGEYFTFAAGAKAEVAWGDVKDKPETFPPSAHTHDKIVDGEREVRADLTAKVIPEHAGEWWPILSAEGWHGPFWNEDFHSQGYGVWSSVSADDLDNIEMGGDSRNPDATELEFPDGTPTHRVPAFRETKLATVDDPHLRVWDEQSKCWWRGVMQGGVLSWEVEEEK